MAGTHAVALGGAGQGKARAGRASACCRQGKGGCKPCTWPVLPGQHEREGRWWGEDAKAKECGLHKGNIEKDGQAAAPRYANGNGSAGAPDIFESPAVVSLTRTGIENLLRLEKLAGSSVKVAKFRADGEQKPFAQAELQLQSFPTVLLFPSRTARPIKYLSEKRDVDSLLAFVNSLR